MAPATLTQTGRAAITLAIFSRPLHLAWGIGSAAWDAEGATLPSLVSATKLVAEVGRRTPTSIGFVTPDEPGDIVIPVSVGAEGAVQVFGRTAYQAGCALLAFFLPVMKQ